ncbi:hypothetical protein [Spiroplasma turonicum]|uniref:ABC transporter ATP-binding protein n=1 Tax=Spiroplasma turonicum TaxID=216946 RepID=A0A0K1P7A1_9MOLU|nr:hypothetical protein [Spiroplasma turonicum]AKU79772.1 ABC transporter ATP-binding protein [Spiroplasma turonicum]ALX70790.1 ABC transporter ATP-binding protein [Spiroplasma turonicum]
MQNNEKNIFTKTKNSLSDFKNNFIIISLSILKNFRTYVYVILIPIAFLMIYVWYNSNTGVYRPPKIFLYLTLPTFAIIFLVNTSVSEWKNSVFLKRIHSAGISRINFFVSLYVFNFILGIISFFVSFLVLMLISLIYFKPSTGPVSELIGLWTFKDWMGIMYSLLLSISISISLGVIISGLINSVALSQSITLVVVLFSVVFSDCLLPLELLSKSKALTYMSYIVPHKHSVWTGIIAAASEIPKLAYENPNSPSLVISFGFKLWIPCLTAFLYSTLLIIGGYYSFSWNNKK